MHATFAARRFSHSRVVFTTAFAGLISLSGFADEVPAPPKTTNPADPAIYGIEPSDDDLAHWAFRPVTSPAPPAPESAATWVKNPIDSFVLRKLGEKGLSPSPSADDRTWLRRVSFDLIGLPPTPDQLASFLSDSSPGRSERVVDRL